MTILSYILFRIKSKFDITEDIHKIHKSFIGGGVGGEIGVDVAIVPVFGTHEIGVIGSGEMAPVRNELEIFGGEDAIAKSVKIVCGGSLHGVGIPGREITLGISPSDDFGHGNFVDGGFEIASFGDGDEFVFVFG